MDTDKMFKWGLFGGAANLAAVPLMKLMSGLISKIPGVTLDLQSVSISTTGVGQVINPGLNQYVMKILGKLPSLPFAGSDWLWSFIGGAMFAIVGYLLYENIKALQFAKSKAGKVATVFVVAGLVVGALLAGKLAVPTISGAVIAAIDALILGVILVFADDILGLKLIP